jgi:hypothetical protein
MRFGKQYFVWAIVAILWFALAAMGATAPVQSDISRLLAKKATGAKLTPSEIALLNQTCLSQWHGDNAARTSRPPHHTLDDYVSADTTYSWIDMAGATTIANIGDDDNQGPYTLGFTFPFYGNNYTQMRVNSNGSISPTDANGYNIYNPVVEPCLPTPTLPNNSIYGWWGDLDPSTATGGGTVKYRSDVAAGRFIVSWENVPFWTAGGPSGSFNFQIIVRSDGTILLNYGTLDGGLYQDSCFAGIENSDGTQALLIWCCNGQQGTPPVSNSAIRILQPDGVPNAVTNLAGQASGTNVTLTWTDPDHDTNGNLLTPDSILIYRSNTQPASQIGHVAHGVQTFTALSEPVGIVTYYVRAKAGTWLGQAVNVGVVVGNPSYANDFDTDNGGWVADGVWSWGAPTNPSAPVPHSGSNMWGTGMSANYNNSVCGHLDLNLGQEVSSPTATLEFWYWYQVESGFDGCNVKVSVDEENTWTLVTPQNNYPGTTNTANTCNPSEPAWTNSTAQPWQYAVIPLGQFQGEVPIFRFTFGSDGSVTYPGFFFDDMLIWGMAPRPDGEPLPVTNLQGNAGGTNTVTFTWTDPNHDTNGNPLTPDSVLIFRGDALPGSQIGHVAHGVQTIAIPNEPSGVTTYYARAKAGTYVSTARSTTVIVGSPGYGNNFEANDGGWVANNGWTWGTPTNPSAPQPHSGTHMWGTGMDANYAQNQCNHLDLAPGLIVTSSTATLEFWAWWSMYPSGPYDGCNVKISTDEGVTWQSVTPQLPYFNQPIYSFTTCMPNDTAWSENSGGWRYVVIPIGQFMNDIPMFRITFGSYTLTGYAGFFFDDMTMWGITSPPNGIPLPVTNLAGTASGTNSVTLTWTDPNHDTNGNPLTPDSVLIYRGDAQPASQIGHVAHGVQTITLTNQPVGFTNYFARAKATTWISLSRSVTVLGGNPSYGTDFEANNGGWVADGVWSWGTPTNGLAPQPYSGTHMWGTGMDANYGNSVCGHLDLNPGLRVASSTANMEFWYWYQIESGFDGCNVKVSVDGGSTWQIVTPTDNYPGSTNTSNTCNPSETAWTNSTAQPWRQAVIPIGQFLNQMPIFRFTFGSDGSVTYPGFFFDNMIIWGLAPRQAVVGHVYHLGGSNPPLSGAWVIAGTDSVQTDANGSYTLSVEPGTYTVTFRHATHCDSVVTGVVVNAGANTTVNASLRAPLASMTVSSLTILVYRTLTQTDSFGVANSGACPLHFVVSDSVTWLNQSPAVGDVDPGDTTWVRVTAVPGIMQPGDYEANIRVNCNSTGSPFIIHVDMSVLPASLVGNEIPTVFALHDNYPNPFNPVTLLPFDVPRQSQVDIVVYNVMGQEVARPVSGVYAAGRYRATFGGDGLPSGLYFVKMTAGDFHAIGKMMLLK